MRAGRILLIRRQRSHGAGSWSTPGGHLDFGEAPAACAARETLEETGVRVSGIEFMTITNDLFVDAGKHYITIWMRSDTSDGDPRISDPTEVAEFGWFDPEALPQPLFLSLENLLAGHGLPSRGANMPFPLRAPSARP